MAATYQGISLRQPPQLLNNRPPISSSSSRSSRARRSLSMKKTWDTGKVFPRSSSVYFLSFPLFPVLQTHIAAQLHLPFVTNEYLSCRRCLTFYVVPIRATQKDARSACVSSTLRDILSCNKLPRVIARVDSESDLNDRLIYEIPRARAVIVGNRSTEKKTSHRRVSHGVPQHRGIAYKFSLDH